MLQLENNIDEEFSEGDRYYWKFLKGLPSQNRRRRLLKMKFKLHNEQWEYQAFYTIDKELRVQIVNSNYYNDSITPLLFDVRVGVVGDDNKELVAFKTRREKEKFLTDTIIKMSQLDSILLKNEVKYIFVEIRSTEETQEIKACVRNIAEDCEELLLDSKTNDMTIQVEHKTFRCHKCVLVAESPVFSAMMEHDMKEKRSGLITIKDAEADTFREFLLFLYTKNVNYLNWNKIIDLYKLADKYDIDSLKNECMKHIYKEMTTENFYEFFLLSQQHSDLKLTDMVFFFFAKRSDEIVQSESWMEFQSKHPTESNILIRDVVAELIRLKTEILPLVESIRDDYDNFICMRTYITSFLDKMASLEL